MENVYIALVPCACTVSMFSSVWQKRQAPLPLLPATTDWGLHSRWPLEFSPGKEVSQVAYIIFLTLPIRVVLLIVIFFYNNWDSVLLKHLLCFHVTISISWNWWQRARCMASCACTGPRRCWSGCGPQRRLYRLPFTSMTASPSMAVTPMAMLVSLVPQSVNYIREDCGHIWKTVNFQELHLEKDYLHCCVCLPLIKDQGGVIFLLIM